MRRYQTHTSLEKPLRFSAKRNKVAQEIIGADYGARTRHLDLGKVALYQMS